MSYRRRRWALGDIPEAAQNPLQELAAPLG